MLITRGVFRAAPSSYYIRILPATKSPRVIRAFVGAFVRASVGGSCWAGVGAVVGAAVGAWHISSNTCICIGAR